MEILASSPPHTRTDWWQLERRWELPFTEVGWKGTTINSLLRGTRLEIEQTNPSTHTCEMRTTQFDRCQWFSKSYWSSKMGTVSSLQSDGRGENAGDRGGEIEKNDPWHDWKILMYSTVVPRTSTLPKGNHRPTRAWHAPVFPLSPFTAMGQGRVTEKGCVSVTVPRKKQFLAKYSRMNSTALPLTFLHHFHNLFTKQKRKHQNRKEKIGEYFPTKEIFWIFQRWKFCRRRRVKPFPSRVSGRSTPWSHSQRWCDWYHIGLP